ncbi:uncharacterized protein [Rutidosis leptorrhynchoides]|uniref:uncharacterized protein n=1 Tax=Rutidosis leptorrhynchoides TaxID=125765 RepID=UPI003A99FFAB
MVLLNVSLQTKNRIFLLSKKLNSTLLIVRGFNLFGVRLIVNSFNNRWLGSRGQLLIWDTSLLDAHDVIMFDRVIGVRGTSKSSGEKLNIVNVYGPHEDAKKLLLWNSLSKLIENDPNDAWVLCGDFNEVRDESERLNSEFIESRARRFNTFILNNNLVDIPMGGRKFKRVCDNGIKFSKIDRFLVLQTFLSLWNNLSVVAMERLTSDHCPVVLKDDDKDFGPKPFKIFDFWMDDPEFKEILSQSWNEDCDHVTRKDCKFLNKLRRLKDTLKSWSKQKFGKLDLGIEGHKTEALNIELKAEVQQLNDSEIEQWNAARKNWVEKERVKKRILKQKARVRWAVDGDENTKFFHGII